MTPRRKRFITIAATVVLVLAAIQSTMFIRPLRDIRIEVEGVPGQSVVASFTVDGRRHSESRQLPANFSFHARHVSFTLIPEDYPEQINLNAKVYLREKQIFSCRDNNGIKGTVSVPSILGLGSNNMGIGGIRPEEIDSML